MVVVEYNNNNNTSSSMYFVMSNSLLEYLSEFLGDISKRKYPLKKVFLVGYSEYFFVSVSRLSQKMINK